jgi:hypothetical protein
VVVVRIPRHGTDLLLTLNTPVEISERSAAAEHAGAGGRDHHLQAPSLARRVLQSLDIRDWGLFGG